jgi:hypothetical protein
MNQPTNYVPEPRSLSQLIASLGPQSSLAGQSVVDPRALAAGIKPSFASVTFKGKVWGIRHRGVTQQLLARDANGQIVGSVPTIDVIIVKSATAISKAYYIEKYKEGDFHQPDCWSTNGQKPDPAAPKIQNETCRGCRWDAFGSRRMDDGRNAKACQDAKRVAIVPAADIKNEMYGGPMLLKLPPSAFNALSELEVQLHMQGYRYFALSMRLSFDHAVAFPKVMFTPVRVLNDYEMTEVLALQKSDVVDRILSEEVFEVTADPNQPDAQEQKPQPQSTGQVVPFTGVTITPPPTATDLRNMMATQPVTAFDPAPPPVTPSTSVPPSSAQGTQSNGTMPTETAEQRIARLEAALAAATAKGKPGRKRSTPVTPAGTVEGQTPALATPASEQSFTAHAAPSDGEPIVSDDDEEGDSPADLDDRIDKLLKP